MRKSSNISLSSLLIWLMLSVLFLSITILRNRLFAFLPFYFSKYRKLIPYLKAQSRHETNGFTSLAYKQSNNLFGMRDALLRPQLGYLDTDTTYRDYKTYLGSSLDMIEYLNFVGFPTEVGSMADYVTALQSRGYFTDTYFNYLNGLMRWKDA